MGKQREGGFRESRCCVVGKDSLRGVYVGSVPMLEEGSANASRSPIHIALPEYNPRDSLSRSRYVGSRCSSARIRCICMPKVSKADMSNVHQLTPNSIPALHASKPKETVVKYRMLSVEVALLLACLAVRAKVLGTC